MSSPSSPVFPDTSGTQAAEIPSSRRLRRWKTLLVVVLLALLVATAWQLLNRQQTSMIAGRPLSYPQTHLHTVAMSSRPGMVYLGTHYGLFTSTDGGQSWPQSQGVLNTTMVTAVAVSPSNPDLLAVLTIPTSGLGRQMGVYVSADAGKHWRFSVPANLPSTSYPYTIANGLGAQGHFYVFFSYAGWFETRDLGQHWYPITSGNLANIQTPSLLTDPTNSAHLLMGGDQGLFETQNGGQSWQKISAVQGYVNALAATTSSAGRPRTILAATDQGLYRWQDGQQVTQISKLPASTPPTRMVVSADGSALYALFGTDLWFSANLGTTWVHRWHFTRGDLVALVLNSVNPRQILAGFFTPGLVLISNDAGKSWQTLTN